MVGIRGFGLVGRGGGLAKSRKSCTRKCRVDFIQDT